jgi:hypothetical protein
VAAHEEGADLAEQPTSGDRIEASTVLPCSGAEWVTTKNGVVPAG